MLSRREIKAEFNSTSPLTEKNGCKVKKPYMVGVIHIHVSKHFNMRSYMEIFILFYIEIRELDGRTENFEMGKAAWWLVVG